MSGSWAARALNEHKTHFHCVFKVFWFVLRDKCFKPLQINTRRSNACKRRQISKRILGRCVCGPGIEHKNVIFENFWAKHGHFVISTMVKIFIRMQICHCLPRSKLSFSGTLSFFLRYSIGRSVCLEVDNHDRWTKHQVGSPKTL